MTVVDGSAAASSAMSDAVDMVSRSPVARRQRRRQIFTMTHMFLFKSPDDAYPNVLGA